MNCKGKKNRFRLLLFTSHFLFLAFLLSSCGYKLQTKADLPFESISIGSIDNKTHEPKLQDRLNKILTETFMEYGFRVNPAAGYRIEADITGFDLKVLSERDLTAAEYEITVKSSFRLFDTGKGTVTQLMDIRSPFVTYFSTAGNLVSVIAQKEISTDRALKDLAQELVRRIVYSQPGKLQKIEDK